MSRIRPPRLATLFAVPAAALAVLSGCSAGQISQTDRMVPAVPGANVDSPHGLVSLRNAMIKYNGSKGYPVGATAPLVVYIVNNSLDSAVTVRGVSAADRAGGASLGTVVLAGGATDIETNPSATPSAWASGGGSASASPSGGGSPASSDGGSPAPSGGGSPAPSGDSPSATPATPGPSANATVNLRIPPNSYARLVPGAGAYLAITGLTASLKPGSSAFLTFNVAGDEPFGAEIPFGLPLSAPARVRPTGTPAAE
jgi:hypothetical protein